LDRSLSCAVAVSLLATNHVASEPPAAWRAEYRAAAESYGAKLARIKVEGTLTERFQRIDRYREGTFETIGDGERFRAEHHYGKVQNWNRLTPGTEIAWLFGPDYRAMLTRDRSSDPWRTGDISGPRSWNALVRESYDFPLLSGPFCFWGMYLPDLLDGKGGMSLKWNSASEKTVMVLSFQGTNAAGVQVRGRAAVAPERGYGIRSYEIDGLSKKSGWVSIERVTIDYSLEYTWLPNHYRRTEYSSNEKKLIVESDLTEFDLNPAIAPESLRLTNYRIPEPQPSVAPPAWQWWQVALGASLCLIGGRLLRRRGAKAG
jgi:hypothetical protein